MRPFIHISNVKKQSWRPDSIIFGYKSPYSKTNFNLVPYIFYGQIIKLFQRKPQDPHDLVEIFITGTLKSYKDRKV
jgi:hypothetical protein